MSALRLTYSRCVWVILFCLLCGFQESAFAQVVTQEGEEVPDSLIQTTPRPRRAPIGQIRRTRIRERADSLSQVPLRKDSIPTFPRALQTDSVARSSLEAKKEMELTTDTLDLNEQVDSLLHQAIELTKRSSFTPDPIRAMWLGLVFPGGGQIYNRKYWKLPIFYGGFLGCMYALNWNSQMLKDYSQAYLDIMDADPQTKSYEKMLPLGYSIEGKEERFKTIFKNKKNYFRKYRDMSIFAFGAVYALAVIDAYVDAELSSFDISRDLSMRWSPSVISQESGGLMSRPISVGIQCNITF